MPERTFAPKPELTALQKKLATMDVDTHAQRVAAQHFMLDRVAGSSFTQSGATFVIESRSLLRGKMLRVVLDAFTADGEKLPGPADRSFDFTNPPIVVHDGTWRNETDPLTGQGSILPNFKENVRGAFEEMVAGAVLREARRLGAKI